MTVKEHMIGINAGFQRLGHDGPYGYILAKGSEPVLEPLTREERAFLKSFTQGRSFRAGHCYFNAQSLCVRSEGQIKYVEGFWALKHLPIPISHAWNTLNGKLVDLTAPAVDRRLTEKQGHTYFGMEISLDMIRRNQLAAECYSPILENQLLAEELFAKERAA